MNNLMKPSASRISHQSKQTVTLAGLMLIALTTCYSTQSIAENPLFSQKPISKGVKETYKCHRQIESGMQTEGDSKDAGCYFILHSPRTGKVLPRTRYLLDVRKPGVYDEDSPPEVTITGTTDKLGRSKFVRVPYPIDTYGMRFVEIVGKGEFKDGFASNLYAGQEEYHPPQWLVQYNYAMSLDDEPVYQSVTDLNGRTVVFASQKSGRLNVTFYRSGQMDVMYGKRLCTADKSVKCLPLGQ
jgi:hypothetical protein